MKNLSLVCLTFFIFGCTNKNTKEKEIKEVFGFNNIRVVEIDKCEYIYVQNGNASWGAHKGNCKYCIQRNKTTK